MDDKVRQRVINYFLRLSTMKPSYFYVNVAKEFYFLRKLEWMVLQNRELPRLMDAEDAKELVLKDEEVHILNDGDNVDLSSDGNIDINGGQILDGTDETLSDEEIDRIIEEIDR